MILIADAGSTKTSWALIKATDVDYYTICGINPTHENKESIELKIKCELPETVFKENIQHIYFFGAGCNSTNASMMNEIFKNIFTTVKSISIKSDITGAAISLLGDNPGIACIIGTGAASVKWNGNDISHQIASGGYILGDEGSGFSIGKKVAMDLLRNNLPDELSKVLSESGYSSNQIIENVYQKKYPNRYIAGISKKIQENIHLSYCQSLIRSELKNYFNAFILPYQPENDLKISFTGSVAFHFKSYIFELGKELNLLIHDITHHPIENLTAYYRNKLTNQL